MANLFVFETQSNYSIMHLPSRSGPGSIFQIVDVQNVSFRHYVLRGSVEMGPVQPLISIEHVISYR